MKLIAFWWSSCSCYILVS